ncbi:hypothetical protein C1X69_08410 [Pseudomonas sp. FW305-67]|nr:hypothetical protein C1X68_05385 [Pseudomonas sp. FW303-C2]PNA40897.1 hypothetical protein C1X71_21255 [Pseudomonas sp. FW306-2-2C-A10BC]PNB22255.1 hypothetical protein C1X69_08410 [Pseudomonas sp. FW305-67]
MHVQRQRTALLTADAQCTMQIQRADAVVKFLSVDMAVGVEHALIAPDVQLSRAVKRIEHNGSPRLAADRQCRSLATHAP